MRRHLHRSTTALVTAGTLLTATTTTVTTAAASGSVAGSVAGSSVGTPAPAPGLRVATYNASLNRAHEGDLVRDLSTPDNPQARAVATVMRAQAPDILVVNEFDHDPDGRALDLFRRNYLENPDLPGDPVTYPYAVSAPVNTGVDSGLDLNGDGRLHGPDDAWGFGAFPGQYGMAVFSRYPLRADDMRTFRTLRWAQVPGALLPRDFYGDTADSLRLSSKSHWDLPVDVRGRRIHLLVSHPTPPSFDGPEQRNGRRNSDEIRLTADYIRGGAAADWIVYDAGRRGGLDPDAEFIVFGDQNSDPHDGGAGFPGINQLLAVPRVHDPHPTSDGAVVAAAQPGNAAHLNPPAEDTADFADPTPGNLRADYVLPSRGLPVRDAHVVWPAPGEPLSGLMPPEVGSDHRMVAVDLDV